MKLIPLSQTKNSCKYKSLNLFAIVDDEDFEYLNQFDWYAKRVGSIYYATRQDLQNKSKSAFMHRMIMGCCFGDGKIVDHIDMNGLNCQRSNLRLCTKSQNALNAKPYGKWGYKGVSCYSTKSRGVQWTATILINGKYKSFCGFKTIEDAALAYNDLAKQHHGEFARLNIIPMPPPVEASEVSAPKS